MSLLIRSVSSVVVLLLVLENTQYVDFSLWVPAIDLETKVILRNTLQMLKWKYFLGVGQKKRFPEIFVPDYFLQTFFYFNPSTYSYGKKTSESHTY